MPFPALPSLGWSLWVPDGHLTMTSPPHLQTWFPSPRPPLPTPSVPLLHSILFWGAHWYWLSSVLIYGLREGRGCSLDTPSAQHRPGRDSLQGLLCWSVQWTDRNLEPRGLQVISHYYGMCLSGPSLGSQSPGSQPPGYRKGTPDLWWVAWSDLSHRDKHPWGPGSRGETSFRVTWFQQWHHLRGPGYTAVTNGRITPNSRGGPQLHCHAQGRWPALLPTVALGWCGFASTWAFWDHCTDCALALNAPSCKWQMPPPLTSHWPEQVTVHVCFQGVGKSTSNQGWGSWRCWTGPRTLRLSPDGPRAPGGGPGALLRLSLEHLKANALQLSSAQQVLCASPAPEMGPRDAKDPVPGNGSDMCKSHQPSVVGENLGPLSSSPGHWWWGDPHAPAQQRSPPWGSCTPSPHLYP